jgi:hypothetical protein
MTFAARTVSILCLLLPAAAARAGADARLSHTEGVMAAISKAGCNLGTCHGNATGKGGFRLSLRGDDPDFDRAAMALELSGRRIDPFDPAASLLLLKGINELAHEGGKRMERDGWEYSALSEWIAAGAPPLEQEAALPARLEASPAEALLQQGEDHFQINARAFYPDGTSRDVTALAVYEPLQNGLVEVDPAGRVTRLAYGEATVLVRYLQLFQPVRVTFTEPRPDFVWAKSRPENYVDRHVFAKLKELRVNPAGLCTDEVFVRRAWLDLAGVTPPAEEARAFVADSRPDKRARLVDRLVTGVDYADFWAMKWADVLKVEGRALDQKGLALFHGWLRNAIASNKPLNMLASEMIAARGSTYDHPPANFYRANRTPADRAVSAAQVFLGTRLQCAECHNHPFDVWRQDDYYNWAAVFGAVDYEIIENQRKDRNDKHEFVGEQKVVLNPKLSVQNPRTGEPARPRLLGADLPSPDKDRDTLQAAAEWFAAPGNELFARAQANRIWFHLMGRGLVDPVDDLRVTNPASHPGLLDELAADLTASGFDMRHLIRVIMLSRAYQLSSAPADDSGREADYSRTLPRRLSAEQLFDSLHVRLGVPVLTSGSKTPVARAAAIAGPATTRGTPAPGSVEAFLAEFGKPKRELACECERAGDSSLGQIFQLITGPVTQRALEARGGLIDSLASGGHSDGAVIETLYWQLLTRPPAAGERRALEKLLASGGRRAALEDIVWSLVNSKEFLMRH